MYIIIHSWFWFLFWRFLYVYIYIFTRAHPIILRSSGGEILHAGLCPVYHPGPILHRSVQHSPCDGLPLFTWEPPALAVSVKSFCANWNITMAVVWKCKKVFVGICKMYLSKLQNAFVLILKCICQFCESVKRLKVFVGMLWQLALPHE